MATSKDNVNEHFDRIKFITKYTINEAKYSLVDGIDEDDNIPEEIWSQPEPENGTGSDMLEDEEEGMPEDDIDPNAIDGTSEPQPEFGGDEISAEPPIEGGLEPEPAPIPEKSTDEIQNDIIKLNLSATQKMNSAIDGINASLDALNMKMVDINKDVEEVKEPTNVEKLTSRKDDSHPYYYNLNDMWEDNWFQGRRQVEDSEQMKQLEDGSYVADFKSLPKYTDNEIKDSFDQ